MVLTHGVGVGRDKGKTVDIGCSEFIGRENYSHLKKLLKADIINRLFTSEGRRKSSEICLFWGGFELGFQVLCIW